MTPKILMALIIIFYPIFIKAIKNKNKDDYNLLKDINKKF